LAKAPNQLGEIIRRARVPKIQAGSRGTLALGDSVGAFQSQIDTVLGERQHAPVGLPDQALIPMAILQHQLPNAAGILLEPGAARTLDPLDIRLTGVDEDLFQHAAILAQTFGVDRHPALVRHQEAPDGQLLVDRCAARLLQHGITRGLRGRPVVQGQKGDQQRPDQGHTGDRPLQAQGEAPQASSTGTS